jgi:hypothetical protein
MPRYRCTGSDTALLAVTGALALLPTRSLATRRPTVHVPRVRWLP